MRNEITSRENAIIKNVAALVREPAQRRQQGLFVAEGRTILAEAARTPDIIDKVFCLDESMISGIELAENTQVYIVNQSVLEKISDVKTPQGIVFTCHANRRGELRGTRILALENIADPGNVGTVIRTAEAFGIDTVAFIGACADIYSPKVVRSTMGALLRVNCCFIGLEEFVCGAHDLGLPVYGAALTPQAEPIGGISLGKSAVIIGNEAKGLSPQALDKCDKHVIIPISGIQSLNAAVAAAIFMYEMSSDK